MRKALITGGAGFIGSHLGERLLSDSVEVVVLDNLRTGRAENVQGLDLRMVHGDVTDAEAVLESAAGADCIFHMAAMVSVPESVERPLECVAVNAGGTLNVLEAARRHGCSVVFSSSTAVYGDDPAQPKTETMPPAPMSPYAVTKLDGEYYASIYGREHGVRCACLRYFNVFGPRQDPSSGYAAVVPSFLTRAVRGEDLAIYGDGGQTRDFVYVTDVVEANLLAARSALTGVYNVARGETISILDLARLVLELTAAPSTIRHEPERPGDIRYSGADISRLRGAGFVPRVALREGLERTLEYFLADAR